MAFPDVMRSGGAATHSVRTCVSVVVVVIVLVVRVSVVVLIPPHESWCPMGLRDRIS